MARRGAIVKSGYTYLNYEDGGCSEATLMHSTRLGGGVGPALPARMACVHIKIRPQEAEKRHDKESNAYIQDNNIDPVCESHVLFRMGYPPDILFDSNTDEEDIRCYYKAGAFTAGNGSGVEGSEYHLRCNNKRRGRISRGRYFVYLLCRSGGRHRVLHKLGADSKAKRENTV